MTAINLGAGERIGSAITGAALVLAALARPSPGRIVLALGGAILLQRGLGGHSALYRRLGIDRTRRLPGQPTAAQHDSVLCASEDSFPASDPPAWTPVSGPLARP